MKLIVGALALALLSGCTDSGPIKVGPDTYTISTRVPFGGQHHAPDRDEVQLMGYGLEFKNNSGTVIIDSEYARLMVSSSGRFAPTEDSGLGSTTYFARPVTSQAPPLVFVRPDTVGGVAGLCRMRLIGSAGNWTGFYVRAYDANLMLE